MYVKKKGDGMLHPRMHARVPPPSHPSSCALLMVVLVDAERPLPSAAPPPSIVTALLLGS